MRKLQKEDDAMDVDTDVRVQDELDPAIMVGVYNGIRYDDGDDEPVTPADEAAENMRDD